jgi:predicted Zn finger-like uncharacterized protein
MIVQCSDCRTRYQLDPQRVPEAKIRVRCPKCAGVFSIDGTQQHERPAAASRPIEPLSRPSRPVQPQQPAPAMAAPPRPAAPSAPVPPMPSAPGREYGEIDLDATPQATPSPEPEPAPMAHDSGSQALEMDLEIERPSIEPIAAAPRPQRPSGAAGGFASEMSSATGGGAATATAAPPRPATTADPVEDKARRLARALVSDILVYNRDARDRALAEGNLVQVMGQEIKKSWEMYKDRVTPEVANSTNHFREALNEILANGQQIF